MQEEENQREARPGRWYWLARRLSSVAAMAASDKIGDSNETSRPEGQKDAEGAKPTKRDPWDTFAFRHLSLNHGHTSFSKRSVHEEMDEVRSEPDSEES